MSSYKDAEVDEERIYECRPKPLSMTASSKQFTIWQLVKIPQVSLQ